jgi:hypothetical protein
MKSTPQRYAACFVLMLATSFSLESNAGSCSPIPATASAGQTLYCENCAPCHGEAPGFDSNAKAAANSASKLLTAINSVGSMQFMKGVFSNTDINNIVTYIGNPTSGGGGGGTGGGGTAAIIPLFNAGDLWWNANESGWGMTVSQHTTSNVIVVIIYTYTLAGDPLWLLASGAWTTPTAMTNVALGQYKGPPFNARPFPPTAAGRQVGTLSFTMADKDNATLVYSVDGVTVTKAVTRLPF